MKKLLLGTLVVGLALLLSAGLASAQQVGTSKAKPNLGVTNTPSAKVVSVNQKFTWTVRIKNTGGAAAKNVKVVNRLPETVRLNNIISSQGNPCQVNFPVVTCNPGAIAAGNGETITFYVQGTKSNTELVDKITVSSPNEPASRNNVAFSRVQVR